jgi:hypothetical protein
LYLLRNYVDMKTCVTIADLGNLITLYNMLIFYEEGMLHNHGVAYSLICTVFDVRLIVFIQIL